LAGMNQTKDLMKTNVLKANTGKGGFTLMEILVVMTIIAILAGIMMPAVNKVMGNAKIKNAQQTALQLVSSISTYQTEYRRFPVEANQLDGTDVRVETDETLMNILLGQDNNQYNPRSRSFYSSRNARGRPPRNGLVFNEDGGGRLYDPWGNYYQVMMDVDTNHRIQPPFQKEQMAGANIVAKSIVVWSLGPDGQEAGDGVKDNVITW